MANVAIYDEENDRIIDYKKSVNTPDYQNRADVLINPDVSALAGVPIKYWKHSGGAVVEMTQSEKDALDQAEADAQLAALKQSAKDYVDSGNDSDRRMIRALAWVIFNSMVETRNKVNEIITEINRNPTINVDALPNRTWQQLKKAVKNEIDTESAS